MIISAEDATDPAEDTTTLWTAIYTNQVFYLNMVVLSLTWFTIGFNYYGMLNSWCKISANRRMFEHSALSTFMSIFSKSLAILVCYLVKQKLLPLAVLQTSTAFCYFYMISAYPEDHQHDAAGGHSHIITDNMSLSGGAQSIIFMSHLTSFFESAAFSLVWVITPECFPKKYR
jgi:hypothetical protein